jgi:hypothetical protein
VAGPYECGIDTYTEPMLRAVRALYADRKLSDRRELDAGIELGQFDPWALDVLASRDEAWPRWCAA